MINRLDALTIKKHFRDKFTLSRDGTFMVILDINKTPFLPLKTWRSGKLMIGSEVCEEDMSQEGHFRGFYFKYAHTPDNHKEYLRHMHILEQEKIISEENRISMSAWNMIKKAVIGKINSGNQIIVDDNNLEIGEQTNEQLYRERSENIKY